MAEQAKYRVGQIIHHKLFDYRGVIVDVDPNFQHSDAWYQMMARSNPPKNEPWYHILVDDTDYMTYVAEQNLEVDPVQDPISHPDLNRYFSDCESGSYKTKRLTN